MSEQTQARILAHRQYAINLYNARKHQACGEQEQAAIYFKRAQIALDKFNGI